MFCKGDGDNMTHYTTHSEHRNFCSNTLIPPQWGFTQKGKCRNTIEHKCWKVHWQLSLGVSRPKLERYQKIFESPHYVYIDAAHSPKTLNSRTNRTALQYVQIRCREMPKTYFDTTPLSSTSTTLPSVSHVAPCICVHVSNEEIRSIRSSR